MHVYNDMQRVRHEDCGLESRPGQASEVELTAMYMEELCTYNRIHYAYMRGYWAHGLQLIVELAN